MKQRYSFISTKNNKFNEDIEYIQFFIVINDKYIIIPLYCRVYKPG